MQKNKTVKLGLMPPLTGLVGIYGTEISRAARIACDEINENGGVLGMPLELIIEDDGSLPDSAVAAAFKLVDQHHCSAIIGNLLSNSRIAVAYQVAEPCKIPLLNFSFYEGSIQSRYFFHFAALPNQQIDKMIPYMREKFGPRMFFAGNNYEWPRGSIDAAKRALLRAGGVVVGEEYCPIGTPLEDIERLLDHVEQAAPDVFVPYFAGSDQVNLLTRFTRRGLKKNIAVVMGHYDEMMASILPAEVREGFYSSNTYFMTVDSAENRNYLARLAKQPGVTGIWPQGDGILTNFGEGTYLCVKAFAQAANMAGSLDPESLVEVLRNIRISGPQGVATMDPATQHAAVNTYLSRCDTAGRFNIVENFGCIDPVIPERYNHQRIGNQATLEEDIRLQARILEQMSDGIILANTANGLIVYTNPMAERMFAYDKGELIGKSIAALNDPAEADPQKTAAEITHILNEKGTWRGEVRNIKKDGTTIWCSSSVSTFTHPVHGEVSLGVLRDISERKEAEEALRQSAERMRLVIEATNDGIWDWNILTHEDYLSPRWKEIVGYAENELSNNESTFFDLIHPDDKDMVAQALTRHFDSREPFLVEMRLRHKDGSYRWILSRGEAARDAKGRPVRMLGSITDITERKQMEQVLLRQEALKESEKRSRAIIDASPIPLAINNEQGDITFLNNAFITVLGYTPKDIPTLAEWWPRAYPDQKYRQWVAETWQKNMEESKRSGVAFSPLELNIVCKDKSVRTFLISAAPLEEGLSGDHLVSLYDITGRKQDELALVAARNEAELANAAKSEFLSRMSHELRTPLNAIIGFGQLLELNQDNPLSGLQSDNIHEIIIAGHHLLELINEILDLSRIESGRLDIILENLSVAPLLGACVSQLQPLAQKRNIHIALDTATDYQVQADLLRLREIFTNLLSNAIKYNREGGDIHITCTPAAEQHLRISVRDTGRGIASEALPRLFKPFERLESPYDGIDGTGIGLALSKKLVEAMNGKIGVESVQGTGSTFWFELPLGIRDEVRADIVASTTFPDATASGKRSKLLYIEDSPANLRLMYKIIASRKDIELLSAENAEEGLLIAAKQQPDLILLDIQLPGMDGFEAIRHLRDNPLTRAIPVVALSANAMPKDIARSKEAGFIDYLTKPIDVSRLLHVVDTMLKAR